MTKEAGRRRRTGKELKKIRTEELKRRKNPERRREIWVHMR